MGECFGSAESIARKLLPLYRPAGGRGALDRPIRMRRAATSAGEGVVR